MPTVAVVFGMAIMFYYDDHDPPHFHVLSADFEAKIDLRDLSVTELWSRMRPRELTRLRAWARQHRGMLEENWSRARRKQRLLRIED
jgi:Domain of unknown function (DUF4160)